MKRSKEIKIGLTVIISIFVLVWGINFLKGRNFFIKGNYYYGVYTRVEGLSEGSAIYFKGYKIGSIREIVFHPENVGEFLVTLSLTQELPITNYTVAQLYSVDLMGTKAVQFINYEPEDGESAPITLFPGDTIKTFVVGDLFDQVGTEVLPLKDKVESLIVKLDTVLTNVAGIVSRENRDELNHTLQSFYRSIHSLESSVGLIEASLRDGELSHSLTNIEDFTATLSSQKTNLDSITSNLKEFSTQLNNADIQGVVSKIDSAVQNVNNLLAESVSGNGSLGMLLTDKTLYLNLTDATSNLDRLLTDMRHYPDRYVNFSAFNFGRKVYIQTGEVQGIVFKVKIAESNTPMDELRNKIIIDDYPAVEDYDGKYYIYTIGESHSYDKIVQLADRVRLVYSSATVIALQNGTPIKVKKALKKLGV
ncbi:MAG: MlaD family protein [Cytophagaceae bacterium]|jgi:phospholipid/cholesterol/gamma-HCH transport system substrate-binding protein|nr:MlaD family protein [Cytophagaceae bacterium]